MRILTIVSALMLSVSLWAVNISTSSVEELTSLPGIWSGTAEKIVAY